ncbi:Hypothetical_protein [Hexamita inflata]|uniref:Hypothetical_protein n=1 Tax=Hexamita inflata TaxID=28002 RepID=A0AA86NZQ1_9EUKA|nr:Hypothetical protein HINF_LOCUS15476 [Hexamita inflata]
MCDFNKDWYYFKYEQNLCNSECSITCNYDKQYSQYCCPFKFSTKSGDSNSGLWWIAIVVVAFALVLCGIFLYMVQSRKKRMQQMINAINGQTKVVMTDNRVVIPAMHSNQQLYQQPGLLPQNNLQIYNLHQPNIAPTQEQLNIPKLQQSVNISAVM